MEPVILLRRDAEVKAYPLQIMSCPHAVLADRLVVNDRVGREPVVVVAIDQARSALDTTRFGEAVDGPLSGRRLELLEGGSHFAFAWFAFNPDSEIYSPD